MQHGKTPIRLMSRFFTRERFGEPQFVAGLLLLIFLAQCVWLVSRRLQTGELDSDETFVLRHGLSLWHSRAQASMQRVDVPGHDNSALWDADQEAAREGMRGSILADPNHSALYYLVASAPLLIWPEALDSKSLTTWGWLAHAPMVFFGVMLGASLWYVARRLYGNAGGYVALMLYCFAPGMIRSSALWYAKPEAGAAWGTFGSVFTAIAVAHTLYAPREVVLWNWRRIVLLGVSLALAIGSQYSLIVLLPLVLGFMLYLAPERRGAAVAIWTAACGIGLVVLFATYGFRPSAFWQGVREARLLGYDIQSLGMWSAYRSLLAELGQICPALIIAVPAALIGYAFWTRARYFGNTVPLLVAGLFLLLGLGSPHYPGLGFRLLAIPFLFLFVAGVSSDFMETRYRALAQACAWGLLAAYATWSLLELARVVRS